MFKELSLLALLLGYAAAQFNLTPAQMMMLSLSNSGGSGSAGSGSGADPSAAASPAANYGIAPMGGRGAMARARQGSFSGSAITGANPGAGPSLMPDLSALAGLGRSGASALRGMGMRGLGSSMGGASALRSYGGGRGSGASGGSGGMFGGIGSFFGRMMNNPMILCRRTQEFKPMPCRAVPNICEMMISMQTYGMPNLLKCSPMGIGCCLKDAQTMMIANMMG